MGLNSSSSRVRNACLRWCPLRRLYVTEHIPTATLDSWQLVRVHTGKVRRGLHCTPALAFLLHQHRLCSLKRLKLLSFGDGCRVREPERGPWVAILRDRIWLKRLSHSVYKVCILCTSDHPAGYSLSTMTTLLKEYLKFEEKWCWLKKKNHRFVSCSSLLESASCPKHH